MDRIRVTILSSAGARWEKTVSSVRLPTGFGSLGILGGHAPMLCAVSRGEILCRFGEDGLARIAVSDGIANVANDELTVLVSDLKEIE